MIVSDKFRFVYIDVPRTGSNTLDRYFKNPVYGGKVIRPDARHQKHCLVIPKRAKDYHRIVSVRSPYTRIFSIFAFAKYERDWAGSNWDIETFLDYLLDSKDERLMFLPQWKYIERVTQDKPDTIIRLEDMKAGLKDLPFYSKEVPIEKLNSSKKKDDSASISDAVIQKINEWAGKDFDLFHYEKLGP